MTVNRYFTAGLLLGSVIVYGCSGPARTGGSLKNVLLPANPLADLNSLGGMLPRNDSRGAPTEYTRKLAQGISHEQAGEWEKAHAIYLTMTAKHPRLPEAHHRLGVVADQRRRHREAEEHFGKALVIDSENADYHCALGYCLYLQGRLEESAAALRRAIHLDHSHARAWNNLGLVLGQQGDTDNALQAFRRAGSEADALYNLAFIYASQADFETAKRCFQQALTADPNHRKSQDALASFEMYEQNPESQMYFSERTADGRPWVPYLEGGSRTDAHAAGGAIAGASNTANDAMTASERTPGGQAANFSRNAGFHSRQTTASVRNTDSSSGRGMPGGRQSFQHSAAQFSPHPVNR